MIVQSLSMRFPNTRGFNGNTNYRINQLVDGVNNSAPGLSFSPGNIFGLVQLDVESVELVVGASSALYGPGGMNGTLLMTSKNPFEYEGLSLSLQGGIMHFNNNYENVDCNTSTRSSISYYVNPNPYDQAIPYKYNLNIPPDE